MISFFKTLFSPITGTLDFIQKYFKSLVFILILALIISSSDKEGITKPNLIKIDLSGPIFESGEFLEKIKEAEEDNIKGVLLSVNSPGGAVAPSVEISLALKRLQEKKPVVAYAAGMMTSGSYYASIWCEKIIANPGSTIGSIGVLFQSANIEELAKKIGIKEQVIKAGKYKQIGTPTREWNEFEKKELRTLIDDTYDMFVKDVAAARKLDVQKAEVFADAHVFSAPRAKSVGLVDSIGSIYDAQKEVELLSMVSNPKWKETDKIDQFLDKLAKEGVLKISSLFFGLKAY